MTPDFDLIAIGSGSAARATAYPCAQAGWRVAMIDSRPFGGTCALRGCDPKKVLVGAAESVDCTRRMRGRGVKGEATIDWAELMSFKRTFTEPFPAAMKHHLDEIGIEALAGEAAFTGPDSIQVGERQIAARHIVIATGARPAPLHIPGEDLALTSDDFLQLSELPRRIAFIGGGYIGFEFAHIAARAGASVMVLHNDARPLRNFDADLVDRLCDRTRALGVDLRLNIRVSAIERAATALVVSIENNGTVTHEEVDAVFHSAGRVPDLDALCLDRAGVAHDARGVTVDEYLQSTTNPRVWAAGDAAATAAPKLTPVSGMHGAVISHNLLHEDKRKVDSGPVASVVYTVPPLASVGMTEAQARQSGIAVAVRLFDTSQWYTSRRIGETCSGAKILIDSSTDRILGAHLLGHGAEETINIFAVAMRCQMAASDLKHVLFSYPTKSSDIEYLI